MREILLMLLVILSVPLVFRRPLWGVAIYIGGNIVRPEMLFWGGKGGAYFFTVYFILIVVSSAYQGLLSKTGRLANREYLLMVWLFFAVLVSFQFAQYPVFRGDYYVVEMLKGFVICAFIYLTVDEFSEVRLLLNVLLGCFAFLGVWGIDQHFRGNERLEGLGGSAWGDSNGVATVFVLFLPLALAKLFTCKDRKERWLALGIAAIMAILIVCTKSRAGLLGLVLSVLSYGFYARKMRQITMVALVMAVVAVPFATQAYLERMKTMESGETLDGSARSRFILWQAGLMIFSDNPLFGTGFLTYPEAKMQYEDRFSDLDEQFKDWVFRNNEKKVTHNTYIQIMSDCGLFGAIPYFLLISGGVLAGFRARQLKVRFPDKGEQVCWLAGLSAGITGFAACIVTLDTLLVTFPFFMLVLTGVVARLITRDACGETSPASLPPASQGYQT